MARTRSEDKRNAILAAATQVFAEKGLAGPVAAITSAAGVAEGTLFTYFKTKDELINALYRELKLDLAQAMMSGFPRRTSVRQRLRHVWQRYVEWGAAHPEQFKALQQIAVWSGLTAESRAATAASFTDFQAIFEDAREQRLLKDTPLLFQQSAVGSSAEFAIQLIRQDPDNTEQYLNAGFEMLWAGLMKKP